MIEIGTLLQDRFLVEEQIGVGGMGAVYRAVDRKFGTDVAIKETFYNDRELAEAFEREARLLNGLHHPLFPHVSDHFTEGTGHFLVMEYIEGDDLSTLLKRGERFPFDTVVKWTLDLLDGLDYLHSQDPPIIHRDVKPSNLKLTPRGNLVLLDFGMAKETSGNTKGMRSVFGYSRRYSPLEQIEGTGTDVRSDVFSLGATLYHLLTGSPPVDVLARASAIVAGKPDPLQPATEIDPAVPDAFAALVHSAIALDPDKRFVTARAMWNAVEEATKMPIAAEALSPATFGSQVAAEGFPALKSFENDAETNEAAASLNFEENDRFRSKVPVVADSGVQRSSPHPEPAPKSFANLQRSALIAALALLVLGLFGYGLYQRSLPSEADFGQSDGSAPLREEVAGAIPSPETSRPDSDAKGTEPPADSSGADARNAAPDNEDRVRSSRNVDDRRVEKKAGSKISADAAAKKEPATKTERSSAASRRRTARSEPAQQVPVSSIESVLTGIPDRTRQQRQWESWRDEEELRRQRRIRQMRRRNQPY